MKPTIWAFVELLGVLLIIAVIYIPALEILEHINTISQNGGVS